MAYKYIADASVTVNVDRVTCQIEAGSDIGNIMKNTVTIYIGMDRVRGNIWTATDSEIEDGIFHFVGALPDESSLLNSVSASYTVRIV